MATDEPDKTRMSGSEYQLACPVCNSDTGGFTFSSPERARSHVSNTVDCGSCEQSVTPAVVDRSAREMTATESNPTADE